MTGTPVQNSVDDIGALTSFLRLPVLGEAGNFRKHISNKTKLTSRPSKNDYTNLKRLLSSIRLRRNKTILRFPSASYEVRRPGFSCDERNAYETLILIFRESTRQAHTRSQNSVGTVNSTGTKTTAGTS